MALLGEIFMTDGAPVKLRKYHVSLECRLCVLDNIRDMPGIYSVVDGICSSRVNHAYCLSHDQCLSEMWRRAP